MRTSVSIIAFFALCIGFSCNAPKTEKSELTSMDTVAGNYGAEVEEINITPATEMVRIVEKEGTFEGKITGEITEVCSEKGCWLKMDLPNGKSMRVTFKNYEFFVPKNSQGFPMILEGVATLSETSVKTLQHYAKDAGKSEEEIAQITEPKLEISFEAIGVKIKDKA